MDKTQGKYEMKDLLIIALLRLDARIPLKHLSDATGMDKFILRKTLWKYEEDGLVKKHTSIIDLERLGYHNRIVMLLSTSARDRAKLVKILNSRHCVNSLFTINNDQDLIAEAVFRDKETEEEFMKEIESSVTLKKKQVFHIKEDIKREDFVPADKLIEAHAAAHRLDPNI